MKAKLHPSGRALGGSAVIIKESIIKHYEHEKYSEYIYISYQRYSKLLYKQPHSHRNLLSNASGCRWNLVHWIFPYDGC